MTSLDLTPDMTAWAHALPADVRRNVHPNASVIAAVGAALRNGWTTADLARECSRDLGTAESIGATVLKRLRLAATTPPPKPVFARFIQPKCGQCNPARWLEDPETGQPIARCECAS